MSPEESTSRAYTSTQASSYSTHRTAYHPRLYSAILSHHTSTSGRLHTLLDLGCGPGNSTRPLARHFDNAYGIDASEGMIGAARMGGGVTVTGKPIRFEIGRAEACGQGIIGSDDTASERGQNGEAEAGAHQVDLVTGGMAAHWFDLKEFWSNAQVMVRSGGTVAFWIVDHMYFHPSTPHASELQPIFDRLMREDTKPYETPGNRMCRERYANLPLPWHDQIAVPGFSDHKFVKKEWDVGGLEEGKEDFFLGSEITTWNAMEEVFGTFSMVQRWREAHADAVASGKEEDMVKKAIREMREIAGQDIKEVRVGRSCVLVMLKRE